MFKKIRKNGENVLLKVWGFVCDLIEIICGIYRVALGRRTKRYSLKAHAICSAIATVMTCGVIAKLVHGSWIWSGFQYAMASVQKRLAIAWASDGDWYHWMTRDRYLFFKALKEDLISSDGFAKFLNDLAADNGIILKIAQLALILLCVACVNYLVYITFKCLRHFAWSMKAMLFKKIRANRSHKEQVTAEKIKKSQKVIDINDARRKRNVI